MPEKTVRDVLEDLCHNTMGNPPYRIDQALSAIREHLKGKLDKLNIYEIDGSAKLILKEKVDEMLDKEMR